MNITHFRAAQEALKLNPDLEIFQKNHPRSVYNIVPEYVRESMDKIPEEYLVLSWVQLKKEVEPDLMLDQLRVNFWLEYRRAQVTSTKMNMSNVYTEICAASTFNEVVVANPQKLVWLLCPPTDFASGMRAILERGLHIMFDVVTHPSLFSGGEVDTKLLNQALKIIDKAIVAVHGLPTIRTETKSVNVNLNASEPSAAHQNLEEKRKELERLKAAREAIPVIPAKEEES